METPASVLKYRHEVLGYREEQALRLFATPGTIRRMEDAGMDVNNARKTLLRLLKKGFLSRHRAKRKGNRGQPPWVYVASSSTSSRS